MGIRTEAAARTADFKTPPPRSPHRTSYMPSSPHTPRTGPRASNARGGSAPRSPSCRFIADRNKLDVDVAHYKLTSTGGRSNVENKRKEGIAEATVSASDSPTYKTAMRSLLFAEEHKDNVLNFSPVRKPKPIPLGIWEDKRHSSPAAAKNQGVAFRTIPTTADRILDAPELRADFYLNVIDWSRGNVIAVALDKTVYLWSATSSTIQELMTVAAGLYVSSLRFINDEDAVYLAAGLSDGTVDIYDTSALCKVRTMYGHEARVASLAWNQHILASGSRTGGLMFHDVQSRDHVRVNIPDAHTFEICGMEWSPDGRHLSTGGNDNIVNIWSAAGQKVRRFDQHTAAVKAMAWCPSNPSLLATGGGSQDRCIRIFNITTGACTACVDTKAQVSALIWHPDFKEIVSAHGYSDNQLVIWKAPSLERITQLTGHTERILSMALSPDHSTVVSAAGDETLRFWKCFAGSEKLRKKVTIPTTRLTASIR